MRSFDHDFIQETMKRLKSLEPETTPSWGRMTPEQLITHLAAIVRFSMDRGPEMPDVSLSSDELRDIVEYVLSLKRHSPSPNTKP